MTDLIDYDEFVDDVKAESFGRKSSTIVNKTKLNKPKLRSELDEQLAKFLANGGKIKLAENEVIEVKHGTATQYKKFGCRCKKCVAWANARKKK